MKQHPIDLLPDWIRARSQARARAGQLIAAAVAAVGVLIVLAVHSRISANQARVQLNRAEAQYNDVLAMEAKIVQLREFMRRNNELIDRYDEVALPLPVSGTLATVINALPESITIDELSFDAGQRRVARVARSRGAEKADEPVRRKRVLVAELTGFAASDADIAELVDRLSTTRPLDRVTLDFSRTRMVRGSAAREFRLSFRIDLDQNYQVATVLPGADSSLEVTDVAD